MKSASRSKAAASPTRAKAVDHLVLPVPELAIARKRFAALGFTVAPDALHPFGTENCCVYFSDGIYLEPLAVAQRETCEQAVRKGNRFVAIDQAYRFRRGENGFSAIALASADAASDKKIYAAEGLADSRMLAFGRKFTDAKGNQQMLRFRAAFATDPRSPDCHFFAVERIDAPAVNRKALQTHVNGVMSVKMVVLAEPNPSDFQYILQLVTGERRTDSDSFGIEIGAANTRIAVHTPAGIQSWFGVKPGSHGRGLRAMGMVLGVRDLAKTKSVLRGNDIEFRELHQRVIVDTAPGQGAFIAFEATK